MHRIILPGKDMYMMYKVCVCERDIEIVRVCTGINNIMCVSSSSSCMITKFIRILPQSAVKYFTVHVLWYA